MTAMFLLSDKSIAVMPAPTIRRFIAVKFSRFA